MALRYGSTLKQLSLLGCGTLLYLLAACTAPIPVAPSEPTPIVMPEVRVSPSSEILCSAAPQLRLALEVEGDGAQIPAVWELYREGSDALLNAGALTLLSGDLLVAFPGGNPLPPGRYLVILRSEQALLARQEFTISDVQPTVLSLAIAHTPLGPATQRLDPGTPHFYVLYTFEGACVGAPYWVWVDHDGTTLCRHSAIATNRADQGAAACFREDGGPLEEGAYRVEFSLMGQAESSLIFEVSAPIQTPTPTPTLPPIACAPLFRAAGLSPDGTPYRQIEVHEWYTQAIYVGTRCEALYPGLTWTSTWYHEGELVRTTEGVWESTGAEGVIWDSLTGVAENPFLLPGSYTVTLEIHGLDPMSTTLRVLSYERPAPATPTPEAPPPAPPEEAIDSPSD